MRLDEKQYQDEASSFLAAVIESSSDAIITKTLEGIITSWNPAAEEIFGYQAFEVIGQPITILFPPERVDDEKEIIRRIKNGERVEHFETIRKRKDGRLIPVSLTVSPIKAPSGTVIGASKIARDITAQKIHEQRLIDQANELEQFAYVASHDLKEPLRKVAIYTEMLLSKFKDHADPDTAKKAGNIFDAVNRMQKLIEDLLNYSRASRAEISHEPIDLTAVLKEVTENLEVTIKDTGAFITADPLPTVEANNFQMYQLFQNLIGNALKFRQKDQAPKIHLSAFKEKGVFVFTVKDNGIGIDPKYFDQIFRVFQRLHSGGKYPGTGIGLAICKKIVERRGGKIWVESKPGKGSTFFFTMPSLDSLESEGQSAPTNS